MSYTAVQGFKNLADVTRKYASFMALLGGAVGTVLYTTDRYRALRSSIVHEGEMRALAVAELKERMDIMVSAHLFDNTSIHLLNRL